MVEQDAGEEQSAGGGVRELVRESAGELEVRVKVRDEEDGEIGFPC